MFFGVVAVGSLLIVASGQECRDRFLQPFSSNSIWNMPIGSDAVFQPANLWGPIPEDRACTLRANSPIRRRTCPGAHDGITPSQCEALGCCFDNQTTSDSIPWCFVKAGTEPYPLSFHNDIDYNILATSEDPLVPWYNQGNWGPQNNCAIVGPLATHIPFPVDFTTPEAMGNNGAGILMPDNRTLVQLQPIFRCEAGGPVLARYQEGAPVPYVWEIDILGDGIWGAHGGSGLSSFGGTVRSGELSPGSPGIRHALKIEVFSHDFMYGGDNESCFSWPALGCDGYHNDDSSGMQYNGTLPYLRPGALLAIPEEIANNITVTTPPAKLLLDAFRDYGAYIVDDTADITGSICMEAAVTDQLQQHYNISFGPTFGTPANAGTPFYNDLKALFQALHVVTNNGVATIGGGGTPRQPLAPPICN